MPRGKRKPRCLEDVLPRDVAAIRREIAKFLNQRDPKGRIIGNSRFGVYAFYDYDREPIYVGQTKENLRTRIRRHLTNQRTDAVAMNVLDPFEVAEIEVWPIYSDSRKASDIAGFLDAAEFSVFQMVLKQSALGAVLNEKEIPVKSLVDLPESFRSRIVPDPVYEQRKHPDVRIARRASTIAALARVISERDVSIGLRRTLLTQARRLERLARNRFDGVLSAGLDGDAQAEESGAGEP